MISQKDLIESPLNGTWKTINGSRVEILGLFNETPYSLGRLVIDRFMKVITLWDGHGNHIEDSNLNLLYKRRGEELF